jgi:hypothetical protein
MNVRRVAISLAVGVCAVAPAYASLRIVQAIFFPSPDPRTVTNVAHIAFYWRGVMSLWLGALAAIATAATHSRMGDRFERALPTLLVVCVIVSVAQGVFVP